MTSQEPYSLTLSIFFNKHTGISFLRICEIRGCNNFLKIRSAVVTGVAVCKAQEKKLTDRSRLLHRQGLILTKSPKDLRIQYAVLPFFRIFAEIRNFRSPWKSRHMVF